MRNAFFAGLLIRIFMSWYSHGFKHMDEHWQVLEPAMAFVDGFWFRSQEWIVGARSWIYPWIVSLPLNACRFFNIQNPLHMASVVRSLHAILGSLAIPLAAQLTAKILGVEANKSKIPSLVAWFIALWPFSIYCGFHTHGEMLGAVFVLGALSLLSTSQTSFLRNSRESTPNIFDAILAGALFGIAFALKIDVAVAGTCCGLWLLLNRKWKAVAGLVLGAAPFAILIGAVDKATWGIWFQSVRNHAHANLVEEMGNQWGVSPWYEHIYYFFTIGSLPLAASFILLPLTWKKLPFSLKTIWMTSIGFIASFSFVAHKEKRFMAPLVYLAPILAATTLYYARDLLKRTFNQRPQIAKVTAAIAAIGFLIHLGAEIKNYIFYDSWEERVVALTNAGLVPDAQKMLSFQWTAYFYFPRHIPAEMCSGKREDIAAASKGYSVISVAMDGNHLGWLEDNGFHCEAWPHPRRVSKDPVPTAYRCERKL